MSTDSSEMSHRIAMQQKVNAQGRMRGLQVPGQAEVSDILQRAIAELLPEVELISNQPKSRVQRDEFCRAIDGIPLREDYLGELNNLTQEIELIQVIALVAESIFTYDIRLVVDSPTLPIKAVWQHVI